MRLKLERSLSTSNLILFVTLKYMNITYFTFIKYLLIRTKYELTDKISSKKHSK